MYNLTPIYNANTTLEMVDGLIESTNSHWLFGMLLLSIYIIIMIVYGRNNIRVTSLASAFVTLVVGIIMYSLGWIGLPILIIPILLIFIGIFIYMFVE